MPFELGHNEIGDAEQPDYYLAGDLSVLFTEVGLEAPNPVRVMRIDHQIAQKLHAVSEFRSERARGLVDLQLLERDEGLDLSQVAVTCRRLFEYWKQQVWPPNLTVGQDWASLYLAAAEGLDVLPNVDLAVPWVNEFIDQIDEAGGLR